MINLLPPTAWRLFIQEYRRRRLLIAEWLIFCLLAVAIVLTVIFLISLRVKARVVEGESARREAEVSEIASAELRRAVADFEQRLRVVLDSETPDERLSSLVNQIQNKLSSAVRINSFNYQRDSDTKAVLSLRGVATTRAALLNFIESLKSEPLFSAIDSPVSNLIRDRDAPFSISIEINFTRRAP